MAQENTNPTPYTAKAVPKVVLSKILPKSISKSLLDSSCVLLNYATSFWYNSLQSEVTTGWIIMAIEYTRGRTDKVKLFRLFHFVHSQEIDSRVMLLSEESLFNMFSSQNKCQTLYCTVSGDVQLSVTNMTIVPGTNNQNFIPNVATNVSVSIVQGNASEPSISSMLYNYFQLPRYLCLNDVFSIDICQEAPELLLNFSPDQTNIIYFKVCDIKGPEYINSCLKDVQCGYIVNTSVTLYQVKNEQSFIPSSVYLTVQSAKLLTFTTYEASMLPLVPKCFQLLVDKLVQWFQPFLFDECCGLRPLFLIHGPAGVGKHLLLSSTCSYLGIKYWRVNCLEYVDVVPGQAEGKIKALFAQLKKQSPCLLHLENIQTLFESPDGNEDVRALSCFEEQIQHSRDKEWPVIIVGTANDVRRINSTLRCMFLQSLEIEAPKASWRNDIVVWLFSHNNVKLPSSVLDYVITHTSGFVLADLKVLVAQVLKKKFSQLESCDIAKNEFKVGDFTTVIDAMQTAYSDAIGAPKIPSVTWEDVGGLIPLKNEIIRSLKSSQLSSGLHRSGLLLYGPPGTGKTLLAKAVASECGRNFLSVKGPELLNMYVGQSEHNVREVFKLARSASPCIVFFDELDSLAPNRGRSGDSGGVMDRVVSQLLTEMDGLDKMGDVFILAATNRSDLIDPALLRPGRLDKQLYVGPCQDSNSKLSVISALTRKFKLSEDVDLKQIVEHLPQSVTGAEIYAVCSAAWLNAARKVVLRTQNQGENKSFTVSVCQEDFTEALKTQPAT